MGADSSDSAEGSAPEAGFVGMVLVCLFFALYKGYYTPEVVVFLSLLVVWNVGIVSTAEALSGFSNPGVLAIGALFVVVSSIESTRMADKAAKRVLGLATGFTSGFSRLLLCAVSMSAFCNNTPILALLIPVTRDWARTRGYDPAVLLMPLAFACAFGGLLTTVGGGTNLVIQGLLYEAGKEDETVGAFRLFEPSYVGLPLAVAGVGYLLAAAPRVLLAPAGAGDGAGMRDRSGELFTEVEVMGGCELVGRPVAFVLATLGLPYRTLVKVRRRCSPGDAGARPPESSEVGVSKVAAGESVGGGDGDGDGDGDGSETCSLAPGDEESHTSGWAGSIGGGEAAGSSFSKRGGGGRRPFALRRRTYQLLENEDGEEQPVKTAVAVGPRIEMTALRAEGVTGTAWEGGGKPTTARASGGQSLATVEDLHDLPPDARVRAGDVLVLSAARDSMVYASGSLFGGGKEGLRVLGVSTLGVGLPPRQGGVFFELVLSRSSRFLGRAARLDNDFFAARYGCIVVAFRLKGCVGGGVDLAGSGAGSSGYGGGGEPGGGISVGGEGCRDSDESSGSLLKTLDSADSPRPAATAAAATTVEVAADDQVFSLSGDDSLAAVGNGASPRYSIAPTPSMSSFAEDGGNGSSPTMVPVPLPGKPDLAPAPKQRPFRRRRRRGEMFEAGDIVMVLATEQFSERHPSSAGEFLRKRLVGRLPEPTGWSHGVPLAIFALMLLWVLLEGVEMIRAVFAACGILLVGGWVDAKQAAGHVNWGLLLLIGSALGFSKAMANSGLADMAGRAVRESGMSESASLYALFGLTMLCTELISNNAAAALNIPVALSMARELQANYKPFAMTVLVAASCSFLTPIGTPTNTLVWAPGGYKFQDYARLGAPLSLLFWLFACAVIPWLFPF